MGVIITGILKFQVLNDGTFATKLVNEQTHLRGDIIYGY